jgi:hypothetical protein
MFSSRISASIRLDTTRYSRGSAAAAACGAGMFLIVRRPENMEATVTIASRFGQDITASAG